MTMQSTIEQEIEINRITEQLYIESCKKALKGTCHSGLPIRRRRTSKGVIAKRYRNL